MKLVANRISKMTQDEISQLENSDSIKLVLENNSKIELFF